MSSEYPYQENLAVDQEKSLKVSEQACQFFDKVCSELNTIEGIIFIVQRKVQIDYRVPLEEHLILS